MRPPGKCTRPNSRVVRSAVDLQGREVAILRTLVRARGIGRARSCCADPRWRADLSFFGVPFLQPGARRIPGCGSSPGFGSATFKHPGRTRVGRSCLFPRPIRLGPLPAGKVRLRKNRRHKGKRMDDARESMSSRRCGALKTVQAGPVGALIVARETWKAAPLYGTEPWRDAEFRFTSES